MRCPVHEGFDPLSPAFLADPYAVLASLPREQPVFYAPSLDYYVVTRYADADAVFLDPETYSAATAQLPLIPLVPEALTILAEGGHRPQPSMVSLDPPAHTRLRRPMSRAFTPRRVAAMEDRIRATVDELLDAVNARAPFDLVASLTFPLPATIIFSLSSGPAGGALSGRSGRRRRSWQHRVPQAARDDHRATHLHLDGPLRPPVPETRTFGTRRMHRTYLTLELHG